MRYKASEKRECIELVERSSLPVRRTLDRLGIPKSTYYSWYERCREGGDAALEDARPNSGKAWNRLPARIRQSILKLALERPELSSREVAVLFTEQHLCICATNCTTLALNFDPDCELKTETIQLDGYN